MRITEFPCCFPRTLSELQAHLQRADLVVGNDSGPMHLAGCLGLEGAVLFGPASPAQWAPPDLSIITTPASCAPCTQDGQINCPNAVCMQQIDVQQVKAVIKNLLMKPEYGSQNT